MMTAKGEKYDFVSRGFAPSVGIDEDPVTGSSHAIIAPFWGEKLNKKNLTARQLSSRPGDVNWIKSV
jgi:predicted PhzF superfamily epimerase YddE/YHI9